MHPASCHRGCTPRRERRTKRQATVLSCSQGLNGLRHSMAVRCGVLSANVVGLIQHWISLCYTDGRCSTAFEAGGCSAGIGSEQVHAAIVARCFGERWTQCWSPTWRSCLTRSTWQRSGVGYKAEKFRSVMYSGRMGLRKTFSVLL